MGRVQTGAIHQQQDAIDSLVVVPTGVVSRPASHDGSSPQGDPLSEKTTETPHLEISSSTGGILISCAEAIEFGIRSNRKSTCDVYQGKWSPIVIGVVNNRKIHSKPSFPMNVDFSYFSEKKHLRR